MSAATRTVLARAIDCLEILNKRPRPMCRDCADEDGICPNGGLDCDMRKLIADARAAIAPPVAAGSVDTPDMHRLSECDSYGMCPNETGDYVLYDDAITWGAQQREAGRKQGEDEMGLSFDYLDRQAANARAEKAEARVKELEAGRQALQAEGKHPAPCARHCEANAFRIEVRRLEAESAHKQSIIDRLMLQYCPDEMTAEQVKEWGEHQVRAEVQHHPV